jgi:hypothetical protein
LKNTLIFMRLVDVWCIINPLILKE